MITTVTLNAAIDKTYYVDHFATGTMTRVPKMHAFPGGKGINVARVAHLLGEPSLATGFVAGSNGQFIEKELAKQGIGHDFVSIEGESRICLNIIDRSTGASTEVLEQGPCAASGDLEAMAAKVGELAARSRIVSFSGSLLQGVPSDFYARLIDTAKAAGAKVFLDTSGDALLEGIQALPYFIKPNEDEVAKIIGRKLEKESDLYESILDLIRGGIACVAVSLGEKGSIAGFEGQLYRIRAPRIEAVNTVGCGDSFVAGMAVGMSRGQSLEECLRLATASGTANALMEEAGNVRPADVERLLSEVIIERV
ncbi:1-phosphofructokinase [Paenibacillus sp. J2TS4]|uniref:1-phosphofructokinase n=1 Tax=Paenibacillus sp. J2TS4 TaxID=2807194 RepID=UPI001B036506|nr:1-phosphofructokinase [Paenibacillus sp. J2TS4]GIP33901.1 tagatose-6-phosphate kinase [Paenibacillus sp. J2TS4]